MRTLLFAILMASLASAAASQCKVVSGPGTAVLLELYTSEGCSSCPPADRWLSRFAGGRADARVVPIAFHVQYWDYIGWKDMFGDARFTQRQRLVAAAAGARYVYTPQVIVAGRDAPDWSREAQFMRAVEAANSRNARATLAIEPRIAADGTISGAIDATLAEGVPAGPRVLTVVAMQSGLSSRVTAGENRGEFLKHDFVARDVAEAPVPGRKAQLRFAFPPRPGWDARHMSVAAFLQDTNTGEVLQAIAAAPCP